MEQSNLSRFINDTTDLPINEIQRRKRRSILDKLSKWSHGNWCGAYTGGYENHCKKTGHCRPPYDKVHASCKECNPVKDGLDAACMEHDR